MSSSTTAIDGNTVAANGSATTTAVTPEPRARMTLAQLRSQLLRMEETILFALIERACFSANTKIYSREDQGIWLAGRPESATGSGAALHHHEELSFLEHFLRQTEMSHSQLGRYVSEDENAFFAAAGAARPVAVAGRGNAFLQPNEINFNHRLLSTYINEIVPLICRPGDDQQYGSSAAADIVALQALSRRVHYGKQVAEVKFQAQPKEYMALIAAGDREGIMELLTNSAVEARLLERVRIKAAAYGTDPSLSEDEKQEHRKIPVEVPVQIYRDYIIPLTKDIEVEYLLQRPTNSLRVAFLGEPGSFCHMAMAHAFPSADGGNGGCESEAQVVDRVVKNSAAYGILPLSNTVSGTMRATCALLGQGSVSACGEVHVTVAHHLMSKRGAALSGICRVYSHPNALSECAAALARVLPGVPTIPVASTSQGARLAAQEDGAAALGSAEAARLAGLEVVRRDMQDAVQPNVSRFLVICKASSMHATKTGNDKTLLFLDEPPPHTGAPSSEWLAMALDALRVAGVPLVRIDSQTRALDDGRHCQQYLMEIRAHASDAAFQEAVQRMQSSGAKLAIAGSFCARDTPMTSTE